MKKETLIKDIIDNIINPILAQHSGSCELVRVMNDIVYLKLNGGCSGCPSRKMTLLKGISPILKDKISEIKEVELVD